MQIQLDMFDTNHDMYFFQEIEKVKHSMDKRTRALFSLLSEMQEQIIKLQSEKTEV